MTTIRNAQREPQTTGAPPTNDVRTTTSAQSVQLKRALAGHDFAAQVQMLAPGGGGARDVHAAAEAGVRGSGGALPHREAIQRSFGRHDVAGVAAHVGGAAASASRAMGAEAYATGNDVAFAGAPDLHTAAHEAAHIVQQRGGVSLAGGVGEQGDRYEQHADQVADAVVQGKSAEGLLDRHAGGGDGGAVQQRAAPVQRYQVVDGGGDDVRVSDDGKMAVLQESGIGGQTAYATPSLIKDAAQKLKAATSVITLTSGGLSWISETAEGVKTPLVDIVPTNTANNTRDTDMQLWAHCGRSAATVSGMDGGTGQGGARTAAKYEKNGETKVGNSDDWMDIQKVAMYIDLFTKERPWWKFWKKSKETNLNVDLIAQKMTLYKATKKEWSTEPDEKKREPLERQMARLSDEMDTLARAEYEKLDADAKDAFDKDAKINAYADPEIGEAFHISTGGPAKQNGKSTWNFHWAGVVMKSAGDTMTLENYSVSDYEVENDEWAFQLYGVGKKGQSAHEEHRDVHGQHGENPTTMTATRVR